MANPHKCKCSLRRLPSDSVFSHTADGLDYYICQICGGYRAGISKQREAFGVFMGCLILFVAPIILFFLELLFHALRH